MLNLNGFAKEVHENAVAHGWWDIPRPFCEISTLIHSEWSEALEEMRARRPMRYFSCAGGIDQIDCDGHPSMEQGDVCVQDVYKACNYRKEKPEGIAVEIIDGCIRVLDWFGFVGKSNFPDSVDSLIEMMSEEWIRAISEYSLPQLISDLHGLTVDACRAFDYAERAENMQDILSVAFCWIDAQGFDVEALLLEKHEYNKSRPYRHGGKVL